MKFLSELISCYCGGGGSTESPEEETTATLPPREKVMPLTINYTSGGNIDYETSSTKNTRRRRLKKLHSASNSWKPVLSSILENGVIVSDAFSNNSKQTVVSSAIKSSVKSKSASRSSSSDGDNHRKSVDPSSFLVFSPAPFMF